MWCLIVSTPDLCLLSYFKTGAMLGHVPIRKLQPSPRHCLEETQNTDRHTTERSVADPDGIQGFRLNPPPRPPSLNIL